MATTPDFKRIMRDPTKVFSSPREVAADPNFTVDQKVQILQAWEFDARQRARAEEENMPGPTRGDLHDIRRALRDLAPNGV